METFGVHWPDGGRGTSATGYLVADDLVLTARHNVFGVNGSPLTCSVRRQGCQEWCEVVTVTWASLEYDLALLSTPSGTLLGAKDWVTFGWLGGSQPVPVDTMGYALAQVRPGGVRDVEQAWGKVAPFTRVKAAQMVMSVESSPPGQRADGQSSWAGMSGAPLFADGRLVGVVRAEQVGSTTDRLIVEPITRLFDDVEAVRLCGLDDARLIEVTAPVSGAGTPMGERLATSGWAATSVAPGPAVAGAFTGRVEDLAWLDRVVGGVDPEIAVLHGLGGVGKTTVAAKYFAGQEAAGGPCWWIGADSATNVTEGLAAAAWGLRLSGDTSEDLAREALTWLVQQADFLLVLDNVEARQDVEPVLARLRPARAGRIVITTRLAVGWIADRMRVRQVGVLAPHEAVRLSERTAGHDSGDDHIQPRTGQRSSVMARLLFRCLTVAAVAVAGTFAALAVNRIEGDLTQIWTDGYFWAALAATVVATLAAGSQGGQVTKRPAVPTTPQPSEQTFSSASASPGGVGDSFEATWAGDEPLSKYTDKNRVVLSNVVWSTTLAALLTLGITTLPWVVQSRDSNDMASLVSVVTFVPAILIGLAYLFYIPGIVRHLLAPKRRIPWRLAIQSDGIHLATPDWQHLISWDQVQNLCIRTNQAQGVYTFSALLVRFNSTDSVPPFPLPAGWPYPNEHRPQWAFPYLQPVCVIGPTTVNQRTRLIAALARLGGERFTQEVSSEFVAAPIG